MTRRFSPREGILDSAPTLTEPWRTFACLVPFTDKQGTPLLMSYGGTTSADRDPLDSAAKGLTNLQIFDLSSSKWQGPKTDNTPSIGPVLPGCGSSPDNIWVYNAQYGVVGKEATSVSLLDSVHASWSAPTMHGQLPVTRFGAAFATVGSKFYMHGGVPLNDKNEADSPPTIANNLDILTPSSMSWTYASNGPARKYHTLCYLSKPNVVVLFGGADQNINSYNDVKVFSGEPSERVLHSAVCSDDTMYVFGGLPSVKDAPTDRKVWMLKAEGGSFVWNGPAPRGGHAAAIYDNKMYVFGGIVPRGQDNDMYQLDLKSWQWSVTSATDNSADSGSSGVSSKVVIIAATYLVGNLGFFSGRKRRGSNADSDSAHSAEIKGETAASYYQRDSAYQDVGTPADLSPDTIVRQPIGADYSDAYADPDKFRRDVVAHNYMPTPHANPSVESSVASFLPPIMTSESPRMLPNDMAGLGEPSPIVTGTPMTTSESVATDSGLLARSKSLTNKPAESVSMRRLSSIIDQQTAFNMYGPEHRRFEDEYRHAEAINQILLSGKPIPAWLRDAIKEAEKSDLPAKGAGPASSTSDGDTKQATSSFTIANNSSS
ncbi:galactose oxidase [Linderina pennispora]|uniref:Galactose oxidase n=1 Tax=Linderina pennispora TaxID=61395 RepID=A0A1Y1WAM2_9FUNG|nr:galactose oxidase [Linderina pennispora]ORX70492.1 galactose oxidase [Linderina pennispora]